MIRPGVLMFAAAAAAGAAPPLVDRQAPATTTSISRGDIEKLPIASHVEDLLKTCPTRTIPTVNAQSSTVSNAKSALGPNCIQPDDLRMVDIYRAHNFARAQVGSPPLVWDRQLALGANLYAQEMARNRQLVHSSRDNRNLVRENLLSTPRGWSPQQMIGRWIGERQNLVPGIFPNVSRTGNWADVAHYTQMVWPTTTSIGCAIQPGGAFDWLICRYSPPGNRDGVAIGPGGVVLAKPRPEILCVNDAGGVMMCPGPGEGGKQNAAGPRHKQNEDGNGQGANGAGDGDHPATRERETEPATAPPDEGVGTITGDCGVGVIAKVHIKEPVDPQQPNKTRREKESHNLAHGFSEIVIPYGWDATVDFRPDPNPRQTFPVPGTMVGTWSIQGLPVPYEGTVTGGYAELRNGWTTRTGPTEVNPTDRPSVQQHQIHAEWDPTPPTKQDKCPTDYNFTVTFAAEVPEPDGLNLRTFVEENARRPGTRGREHPTTGTRAFHEEHPHGYSRNHNIVVPIGIYWSLPHDCCGIKPAKRKVIQFARAAIHGPNGRQGKAWGLDILPDELTRAGRGTHDPTYTGHPRGDGDETPTPGGAGGTRTMGDDVLQWDAPGMPKDLYDRLFAAQGASVYRQQFLSLLVCRPPGTTSVQGNLTSAKICRVGIMTVRWDFPGQAGITPRPPRRGAPPIMPYRQPSITISFDERDGHCAGLRAFLEANGLLAAFEHPSSDARNLEILPELSYGDLDRSVSGWESNPFGDVHFP